MLSAQVDFRLIDPLPPLKRSIVHPKSGYFPEVLLALMLERQAELIAEAIKLSPCTSDDQPLRPRTRKRLSEQLFKIESTDSLTNTDRALGTPFPV
jgi:hypothetical protein